MLGGKSPENIDLIIALYDHVEALEFSQAHIMQQITFSAFLFWYCSLF